MARGALGAGPARARCEPQARNAGQAEPTLSDEKQTHALFDEQTVKLPQMAPAHSGSGPGDAANARRPQARDHRCRPRDSSCDPGSLQKRSPRDPVAAFSSSVMDTPFAGSTGSIIRSISDW